LSRWQARVFFASRSNASGPQWVENGQLSPSLPGTDGLGVTHALREREIAISILMLIGPGDLPLAVEAMRLGAVDFLEKPYRPGALLKAIRHACNTPVALLGARPVNK
jgi:FixJ family two-component response regulator